MSGTVWCSTCEAVKLENVSIPGRSSSHRGLQAASSSAAIFQTGSKYSWPRCSFNPVDGSIAQGKLSSTMARLSSAAAALGSCIGISAAGCSLSLNLRYFSDM